METNPVPQPVPTPASYTPKELSFLLIPMIASGDLNITTTVENSHNATIVTVFSHGHWIGELELLAPCFPQFGCVEDGADDEYDQTEDFEARFRFRDLGWIDTKDCTSRNH